MAPPGNFFALLDDEEGDDVSKLLERVAAKASLKLAEEEKKKEQQSQSPPAAPVLPSRPAGYGNVRSERRGGRGSGRSSGNDVEQFENGQPDMYRRNNGGANGYQKNNGGADAYQRSNGGADGYQRSNGGVDGYRRNNGRYWRNNGGVDGYRRFNGGADGYQQNYGSNDGYQRNNRDDSSSFDGNWQGQGRGGGGGRGRGCYGYQQNYGGADGYQQNYGSNDGYWRNNGGDSTAFDGNWQGQRLGRGGGRGRGRGRGLNKDHGFRNESQVAEGNQYPENQGQEGVSGGGGEKVTESLSFRDEKQLRNGNWSYGGERKGNGGGNLGFRNREGRLFSEHDGRDYGRRELNYNSETKKARGGNMGWAINGEGNTGGAEKNVLAKTEVSKAVEHKWGKVDEATAQYNMKNTAQEEEEYNKITLEEYEKVFIEKRKALEALKTEERKVILDKDFELMQLVEKKKEDSHFVMLKSKKDKLKRNDSLDKDVKVSKVKNHQLLLGEIRIRGSRRGLGRGRGREDRSGYIEESGKGDRIRYIEESGLGERGRERGRYSEEISRQKAPVPVIEDSGQFPDLGKAVRE